MKNFRQLWSDLNSNQTYLIESDHQKGVLGDGRDKPKFVPYKSGFRNSKNRIIANILQRPKHTRSYFSHGGSPRETEKTPSPMIRNHHKIPPLSLYRESQSKSKLFAF